jgi:hypothetical protein
MVALDIAGAMEREAIAVCESEFADPVTVMVAPEVVAAAVDAVRVNCPSCPGVSERVEGVAVTPAGSPLSVTVTGSLKPFTAPGVTESVREEPPLGNEMEPGAAERVKSGMTAGVMARLAVAVCESEAAEPVAVIVAPVVVAAAVEAVSVN